MDVFPEQIICLLNPCDSLDADSLAVSSVILVAARQAKMISND